MELKSMPVLDVYELEKFLMDKYGNDFYDLAWILFDDDRIYDGVYIPFWYSIDEEIWEPDRVREEKRNVVRKHLRDIFPDYKCILIYIYW